MIPAACVDRKMDAAPGQNELKLVTTKQNKNMSILSGDYNQ